MKLLALFTIAFALFTKVPAASASMDAEPTSTERHVHGVITSVEPATMTIATSSHAVTGRIDPTRTKITLHGKPAKFADLKITAHAKAELCLDDVWVAVDAH